MRTILQRVNHSSVRVDGKVVGEIERGLMALVGFGQGDDERILRAAAEKITTLRIFPDERGRFHLSLLDIKGGLLLVPQFTLFADASKGRRPEFFGALEPDKASPLFDRFVQICAESGATRVERGVFGADMKVLLENDGPVTISLEFPPSDTR